MDRKTEFGEAPASRKSDGIYVSMFATVVPFAFAVAGFVWVFGSPEAAATMESRVQFIALVCSALVGFSLANLMRNIDIQKKVTEHVERQTEILSGVRKALVSIEHDAAISKHLSSDNMLASVRDYSIALSKLDSVGKRYPFVHEFCSWKMQQFSERVTEAIKDAADEFILIDDPVRELTSSIELLRAVPKQSVVAVSFEDLPFWTSLEGERFLEAHKSVIENGVKVTRIFVLKSSEESEMANVMHKQVNAGIVVYKVAEQSVLPLRPADIVIYDDVLVRRGYNEAFTQNNMFKRAQLVMSASVIQAEKTRVSAILNHAELVEVANGG
jgi:hypothetical protein